MKCASNFCPLPAIGICRFWYSLLAAGMLLRTSVETKTRLLKIDRGRRTWSPSVRLKNSETLSSVAVCFS